MDNSSYYVAIIGGAVSGSEAAFQLTQKGIKVAVFEQNPLPYGKIEDGLPKWHVKLRNKEESKINEKLSNPLVQYIPCTRLGKDIRVNELLGEWGFNAVILANGAWNDRTLPIAGIDEYIGKGFCYQNQFIYWYNHHHEPNYQGEQYDTPDDAVVIGGGLASLDVVKVLMFANVQNKLQQKGIDTHVFNLDKSISKFLDNHDLTLQDLGLKGCHLYYRRRVIDMPLTPMDTDTEEKLLKAQKIRKKIFENFQSKYLFQFHPQVTPVDIIVKNDRLVGMVFQKTKIVDGRAKTIEGRFFEIRAPLFISSIGSLPSPVDSIPMDGSVYHINESDSCKVVGFDNLFAIGNAVTGRGNIIESMKHGRSITKKLIDKMGINTEIIKKNVEEIADQLSTPLTHAQVNKIDKRIKNRQTELNYDGDYTAWIAQYLPVRLEDQLGIDH